MKPKVEGSIILYVVELYPERPAEDLLRWNIGKDRGSTKSTVTLIKECTISFNGSIKKQRIYRMSAFATNPFNVLYTRSWWYASQHNATCLVFRSSNFLTLDLELFTQVRFKLVESPRELGTQLLRGEEWPLNIPKQVN